MDAVAGDVVALAVGGAWRGLHVSKLQGPEDRGMESEADIAANKRGVVWALALKRLP